MLSSEALVFEPEGFQKGNLGLKIRLKEITAVEGFLLYGISKNVFKISTEGGKQDMFVINEFEAFQNDFFTFFNQV